MAHLTNAFVRFRKNPSSVRYAVAAIISVTVFLVVAGAVLVRVFAPDDYPTFGEAVWFTLQTVTTVGYGDTTPESWVGRLVASVVMLVSIGLITVITAAITSLFVQSVRQGELEAERAAQDHSSEVTRETLARIEAALEATQQRLDRIERAAATPGPDAAPERGTT